MLFGAFVVAGEGVVATFDATADAAVVVVIDAVLAVIVTLGTSGTGVAVNVLDRSQKTFEGRSYFLASLWLSRQCQMSPSSKELSQAEQQFHRTRASPLPLS